MILCEIEIVIAEGMTMARQQSYSHFTSHFLAYSIRFLEFVQAYELSPTHFNVYTLTAPSDRHQGQRVMFHTQEQVLATDRERVAAKDQALAEAEAELSHTFHLVTATQILRISSISHRSLGHTRIGWRILSSCSYDYSYFTT